MGKFSGRGFGGVFSTLGTAFKFLFTLKGALSITLILILLSSFNAFQSAKDSSDPVVFFKIMGEEFISYDAKLYDDSRSIIENGGLVSGDGMGFWDKIRANFGLLGRLLSNLWYLYTFVRLVFWGTQFLVDDSNKQARVFFTVFILAGLQIAGNFAFVEHSKVVVSDWLPFRGVFEFFKALPFLVSEVSPVVGVNESNSTLLNKSVGVESFNRTDYVINMVS